MSNEHNERQLQLRVIELVEAARRLFRQVRATEFDEKLAEHNRDLAAVVGQLIKAAESDPELQQILTDAWSGQRRTRAARADWHKRKEAFGRGHS